MKIKASDKKTKLLVTLAVLTAIVAILAYFGGFIKIGLASISLTLVPVVLGAALCGPWSGAWLGFIAGAVFFLTPDAAFWLGMGILPTILIVLLKGFLAGLASGYIYKLLERVNKYLAVIVSAIVCPVVNTGIFLIGTRLFFWDFVTSSASGSGKSVLGFIIVSLVSINFVFELLVNIVLSPSILKLLNLARKSN